MEKSRTRPYLNYPKKRNLQDLHEEAHATELFTQNRRARAFEAQKRRHYNLICTFAARHGP